MKLICYHFPLLIIFLLLISSNSPVCHSSQPLLKSKHLCLDEQRTTLMQLQQDILKHNSSSASFDENSSNKVEKWDPKSDCCFWDGVTCDNSGNVIGLNLSFSMISGHVDAIFNLRHLQHLDLARNNFQLTPIPSGMERLKHLTHLNLSYSCFSDQVPAGISRLISLKSLDLSTMSFCELNPTFNDPRFNHVFNFEEMHRLRLEKPNLESFFRNLSALPELYLDSVDLSAQGSNWSQVLSSALPNLEVLSLSQCRLSGSIHGSFENLKSLHYIKLDGNNLSVVPQFLAGFRDLQVLNLANCQLSGNFPGKVFMLPRLRTIDLSNNTMLTGELPEFPFHNSLQSVLLYQTNFQGKLPDSIGNLKFLTDLLLYTCNFSGALPPSLANLTSVVLVDISYNKFSGPIPAFRDRGVPKLSDLRLSSNLLTGNIDPLVFTLPSLKILYLNDNHLSGELEDFSASSSMLVEVYLYGNNLSGAIPRSIAEIPSLYYVSLAGNKFTGTLNLAMFQNLKNLTSLDLSYNSLTIQTDQTDLIFPQLQELKLSKCNLTEFPTFLKNQDQLRTLNLSDNQIRGYVPRWLWTSSLNELDLSQNAVAFPNEPNEVESENVTFSPVGRLVMRSCNVFKFPEFLKVLDSLWYLDLSGNKLKGQVPSWIWKTDLQYVNISHNGLSSMEEFVPNVSLNSLATLDLKGNLLQGSLPSGVCYLSSLSILDASSNNLSGLIPECLGKMGNLSVLNLKGNKYKQVPSDFASASSLRSLNINGNLLEGQLPRSLENCKMLEVLDLGNNMITDTFPFWLNKLPNLRVLVLRNNRFYGQIQIPRTNFSLPSLGIIDLSSNHFTGNLPQRFLESLDEMLANGENRSRVPKAIGQYEYYQDSVTIMSKGYEMVLVRILTIFVSLDISNNRFHGKIPGEIGTLKSLVVLNLSRNALDGNIPSSLGDLAELESLDLSQNKLSGAIPQQLIGLTFLSSFNLSYNNLTGHLLEGNQFNTFTNDSYLGNAGLCGSPLSRKCARNDNSPPQPQSHSESSGNESLFDWRFAISGYGCGIVVGFILGYAYFPDFQYTRGWLPRGRRS